MRLMRALLCLMLVPLVNGCIDPFKLSGPAEQYLVFDGMVTDQPGPYSMTLTRTQVLKDTRSKPDYVEGATITISDDAGTSEVLKELTPGTYFTTNIQGVVGRSYSVSVTTAEGFTYQSASEKLLPVGEITDLHYEFEQKEPYSIPQQSGNAGGSVGESEAINGFNIKISSSLVPGQDRRIRYRFRSTFELFTHPELIEAKPMCKNCPPPCSRPVCSCCHCWVTQHETVPRLQYVENGASEIRDVQLTFVPANERLFYNRYMLEVEQLSITKNVYEFWERVRKQTESATDLFQTAAAPSAGNFVQTSEKSPKMIGVFATASIRKRVLELYAEDIPYPMQEDVIVRICNSLYIGSNSSVKPWYY